MVLTCHAGAQWLAENILKETDKIGVKITQTGKIQSAHSRSEFLQEKISHLAIFFFWSQ